MPPPPDIGALGPVAARAILLARDPQSTPQRPGNAGAVDPSDINNNAVFALFGLIGAAFVIVGIWFFFWAKNGGIHFKEDDWDDYKSTVLRRKGPNGTLLSGATPSTNLGGGSVYKDVADQPYDDDGQTVVSGLTGITGITPGASDVGGRERHKRRKDRRAEKRREKEREKEKKAARKNQRHVGEDGVLVDEDAEAEAKEHLRSYRYERPARVGGLNSQSEGSTWDGSTNPSDSVVSSSLLSNQQPTPTRETPKSKFAKLRGGGRSEVSASTGYYTESEMTEVTGMSVTASAVTESLIESPSPTKKSGGIRKVYSTADRNTHRESERLKAEARRLQEKGRKAAAGPNRRDFSWQRVEQSRLEAPPGAMTPVTELSEEASSFLGGGSRAGTRYEEEGSEVGTDIGTKAYHHPIPELTASSLSGSGITGSSVSGSGIAGSATSYLEEKRKQRRAGRTEQESGYRRQRRGE